MYNCTMYSIVLMIDKYRLQSLLGPNVFESVSVKSTSHQYTAAIFCCERERKQRRPFVMMKRKVNEMEGEASKPKRLRFDMGAAVSMLKNLMSSANAVPFLRKGRFEDCEDKMYLEDVLTRVEDGSHRDIDGVFNDIYKVLKTERDGNEIQLEDHEKQVYDEADALIMAGMMIKTAKSLQKHYP